MASEIGTPGRKSPIEVRGEIERARQELERSVVALRGRLASEADWRRRVRRRPALWLVGAFAVGLWLGARR